jgi:UDP-glucose 4-epimerase
LYAAKEANVDRFVFFSSVKAVSDQVKQPIDETVTKAADTPYGQSKLEAEKLVLQGGYVPLPVVLRTMHGLRKHA